MFALDGVDGAGLASFDRAELAASLKAKAARYGLVRHDGVVFAAPQGGEVLVNMTHLETPLDPIKMSRAVLEGRGQAEPRGSVPPAGVPPPFPPPPPPPHPPPPPRPPPTPP